MERAQFLALRRIGLDEKAAPRRGVGHEQRVRVREVHAVPGADVDQSSRAVAEAIIDGLQNAVLASLRRVVPREADEAVLAPARRQWCLLDLGGGVACLWWGAHRSVVLGDEFSAAH